ncbi:MAG: NAD-dependent epimerase/dehydratase family protein [Rhizomicrobium sp.]
MTNTPETVVIAGATGFIGRNLVRFLKPHVGRIVPVSASGTAVEGLAGHRFDALAGLSAGPDSVVINVAAYRYDAANFAVGQNEILLRNAEIAGAIYEFCTRNAITEVRSASSIAVYPGDDVNFDDGASLDLNRDPHPGELMYGWSKRIGEIYGRLFAAKSGINTVAFRLTNPYGPFDSTDEDKAHVVPAFVIRALTSSGDFTVRGNPEATRDFIYVSDVCDIFRRSLAWRGRNGAYNLGSGENISVRTLAQTILDLTGSEREIVSQSAGTSAVAHRRCRNDRLKADFDYTRFTALADGLTPTIEWYRDALKR